MCRDTHEYIVACYKELMVFCQVWTASVWEPPQTAVSFGDVRWVWRSRGGEWWWLLLQPTWINSRRGKHLWRVESVSATSWSIGKPYQMDFVIRILYIDQIRSSSNPNHLLLWWPVEFVSEMKRNCKVSVNTHISFSLNVDFYFSENTHGLR